MRRKYLQYSCIAIMFALIVTGSIYRIHQVNSSVQQNTVESTQISQAESGDDGMAVTDYALGESIDISGFSTENRTAPAGYSVSFANPRILELANMQEINQDWVPKFGPSGNKFDPPKYLTVEMSISNQSGEEAWPLWFKAESSPWATIIDPNATLLLNGADNAEDFVIPPSETKTLIAAYQLYEPTFSKQQWSDVYDLPYELVLLNYPYKISIRLM